jgi:hypothetical protein
MAEQGKLRVRAVEGRPVADPKALEANIRRYIGWRMKGVLPVEVIAEGVEVDDTAHARDAINRGELIALDEWSAKRGRVEWKSPSAKAAPKKGDL